MGGGHVCYDGCSCDGGRRPEVRCTRVHLGDATIEQLRTEIQSRNREARFAKARKQDAAWGKKKDRLQKLREQVMKLEKELGE